jgi:murein L,D-transpeptidase YcbB/YkuD
MLKKLATSLERWRWLGPVTEKSKIWVNLAENKVYAWQEDTLELVMKVCSGKNRNSEYYRRLEASKKDKDVVAPDNLETPLMKAKVSNLVANPTWHVPRNIMVKELLPAIKKDPAYLANNNYKLFNWKGEELNPFDIDWSQITKDNWKYRIEQGFGPENSLGKVLIQFPNAYSIFMHDTPSQYPFGLDHRHVSHGCVRMAEPLKMVEFLTSFQKKDNYDEVLMAMGLEPVRDEKKLKKYKEDLKDSAKAEKLKPIANHYFRAATPIPVYLVYLTAFVNIHGGVNYCEDGYDRDDKLLSLMPKSTYRMPAVKVQKSDVFSP